MQTGLFTYLQSTSRALKIARDFIKSFFRAIYVDKAWGFYMESLKQLNFSRLFSLHFIQYLSALIKPSNAQLLILCGDLKRWNIERIGKKTANHLPHDLTLDDVNVIKKMIHVAINKSLIKQPAVISDQLLFLTVGAIQIQSQTNSDKAWSLLNQSISSHLSSQKEKRLFALGFFITTIVLCFCIVNISNFNRTERYQNIPQSPIEALGMSEAIASDADPVTMSMLKLTHHKMKIGTCQLPQAAMLPPEQRHAFLLFINKGVVQVQHVENLRLALDYVNCLYPQQLMHPSPSIGNRL